MTNKQAAEKISGLEARIEELEADLATSTGAIETLQGEVSTAAENIVSLTAERDEAVSKLSTAEQTIADANEKIASFDLEVQNKVLHGIANLGFKGELPESSQEPGSNVSLREQINAIPDAKKRQEARLKNWDKI